MSGTRPLVYHWIAYYNDGTKLDQFNKDLSENGFSKIDNNKLNKIGLYPFSKKLAEGITRSNSSTVALSLGFLPVYELEIKDGERPIYYRDCFISQEQFHVCNSCKKEFNYDGYNNHIIKYKDDQLGIKYNEVVPICPNCGAHDYFTCKSCGKEFQSFNEALHGMCPDCGRSKGYLGQHNITSKQYSRERRWNYYYFGKQNTIKGTNIKFLMKISESGDCVVT